jgi:hypothetical protein
VWFGFGEREIERGTDIQIEGEIEREGERLGEIGRDSEGGREREGREIGRERYREGRREIGRGGERNL